MVYKVTLRCSLDLPRAPSRFADVELVVQDGPEPCAIPVDRIILLAACPMFQKIIGMLPSNPDHFDCNCFRPRVFLDGVKPDALRAFVDLVYQGVCDVNQVAYDDVMLVCHQLGFKRKDRLAKEVRAPPEEEEVMIIEDVEQMSSENSCGESEGAQRPPSLGTQNDVNTVQNDVSVDADVGKQTGRATSTPLHTAPIHAVTDMGNSSSISSRSGVLGGLGEAFHQNQLIDDGMNDDENTTSGGMNASVDRGDCGSVNMELCQSLMVSNRGPPLPISLGSGTVPSSRPSSEASVSRNVTDHHLKSSKGRVGEDISNQNILKEMQSVGRQGDIQQQKKVTQRKKAPKKSVLLKKYRPRQGSLKSIAVAAGASQECKLCGEDASEGFSLGRERICKHCVRTKPSACRQCPGCLTKTGCTVIKQWTIIVQFIESNKSASSGPGMKNYGENIKKVGGGAMVSAPPSSGSTDKPLPRKMLRSGGKEGVENVVSKKKRWSSTHSRTCALEDMSKRDRPQRPGREVCFDQKMFSCKKCYKSFQTESVLRRHMKTHDRALRDDDMHSIV